MVLVYTFVLLLHLPSFGGIVEIPFRFADLDSCQRFRTMTERKIHEFSIDLRPGNPKGHAIRPEDGCEEVK